MPAGSRTAFVLTVSDRSSTGEREDTSGEGVAARLATLGFSVEREIIADAVSYTHLTLPTIYSV